MIECRLLIPASEVLIDMKTKRASIINIFDSLEATSFPIAVPVNVLTLLSKDAGDPADPSISIEVKLSDVLLGKFPLTITFSPTTHRARNVLSISALIIEKPGNLIFEVKNAEVVLKSYIAPVTARIKEQPAEEK